MSRRLQSVEYTRQRITAAAFELHATIGPSRTTVRAIAERAGVQRHTVYAHFPELDALYQACTEHGIHVTGMPEPGPWAAVPDASDRLRLGLAELYGWYRTNERMLRNVLFDIDPTLPPSTEPDLFELRIASLFEALADGLAIRDDRVRSMVHSVLQHSMAFESWRSVTRAGLSDSEAVGLFTTVIFGVTRGSIVIDA